MSFKRNCKNIIYACLCACDGLAVISECFPVSVLRPWDRLQHPHNPTQTVWKMDFFFCVCVYVCVSVSVCEWKRQLFPSDAMCPEEGTEDWNGAAHIWSLYKHVLAWPTCASVMTELLTLEILQMLPYNRKARYTSAKHKGTYTQLTNAHNL